jgi:hypothetical protein
MAVGEGHLLHTREAAGGNVELQVHVILGQPGGKVVGVGAKRKPEVDDEQDQQC